MHIKSVVIVTKLGHNLESCIKGSFRFLMEPHFSVRGEKCCIVQSGRKKALHSVDLLYHLQIGPGFETSSALWR